MFTVAGAGIGPVHVLYTFSVIHFAKRIYQIKTEMNTHTHTHTHIHIYIYNSSDKCFLVIIYISIFTRLSVGVCECLERDEACEILPAVTHQQHGGNRLALRLQCVGFTPQGYYRVIRIIRGLSGLAEGFHMVIRGLAVSVITGLS